MHSTGLATAATTIDRLPRSDADHAERLFALSQDLLGAADADGRLRWVNDAWERAMGWPLEELYAHPYLDFVHPDDVAKVQAFAERLTRMPPGESLQVEARARRRDGLYRWLRCSAAVAGGPEPMVYLSGTDVTDLHEALEQLARRTGELERSNAELERFAGVVSHDLRSSLTAVSGFLALLERRHGAELGMDARRLLASAEESSARMRLLVDDLLAYARVGHSGREPEDVDVVELARRVAGAVAPEAQLEIGRLPVVRALPREFEQLLANLIGNAAKFVAPGTRPRMRLSAESEPSGWRFELADNGIGIEPRFAGRVFGMFQRLHGGEAYPGMGIGLAIAAKVVEGAGGRIWVRPGEDEGSVFAFTWPA
jgi:PAS domain S-box-containing protein